MVDRIRAKCASFRFAGIISRHSGRLQEKMIESARKNHNGEIYAILMHLIRWPERTPLRFKSTEEPAMMST